MVTTDPTVMLVIGGEAIAYDERGEIVTAEIVLGTPEWENATLADPRGAGGQEGYDTLRRALEAAEANARLCGLNVQRLPVEQGT